MVKFTMRRSVQCTVCSAAVQKTVGQQHYSHADQDALGPATALIATATAAVAELVDGSFPDPAHRSGPLRVGDVAGHLLERT
jgi:hypothetical protein